MKLTELLQLLTLNPKYRIRRHAEYLQKHVRIDEEHDRTNFSLVMENFNRTFRRLTTYEILRNIIFILLYISVVITFAKELTPWATHLLASVRGITEIIGVSVLTLLFLVLQKAVGAVRMDLIVEHSHLVAIAVKHNEDFTVHPMYKWGLFKDYDAKDS